MQKHRVGIVGFGKIAADQHASAIFASPDFELVAVSNVGSGPAPDDLPSFADCTEMIKSVPELDAVSICTPPGPRRMIAAACLEAGKHVLLEKPPAATVSEVTDIATRAKAAGKVAFAPYHAQHNEAVKRAADLLADQTIRALTITWKEDIRRWHPGQEWTLSAGGFGIFDPGINALSILTRILPQPVFISAAELFFPENRQAPIAANLSFSTGLTAGEKLTAAFDWRQTGPQTWDINVEAEDGSMLKLTHGGSSLQVNQEQTFVGASDEYPNIYREFASLLRSGKSQVDVAPFQLLADAFMLGERKQVEAFTF